MSSFDDTYTPLPPISESQPNVPGPTYTSWGCFEGRITPTPQTVLEILQVAAGSVDYNYGTATALMVQEVRTPPSGGELIMYPYAGAQGFRFGKPQQGPFATSCPWMIARNRSQLENMLLQAATVEFFLSFQFFVGNPNVGPA